MIFYPDLYINNIKEITIEMLKEHNIKGLMLDVDNTLIDFDRNMLEGTPLWCKQLKDDNIKMCILSNSNKIDKVKAVAYQLDIPYINFAKKPLKSGFRKAQKILELDESKIAVVGDQIMTDVLGGNLCKMFTILTKPLHEKDIFITKIKRPLERCIVKGYLKKIEKGDDRNVF